jgi:transglutaminase-like putative cysteine protease
MSDIQAAMQLTEFLDFETDEVRAFVARSLGDEALPPEDAAIRLYYAVRDGIRYDINGAHLTRSGLRASAVIARGSGMCIHKSIVFAAAARLIGIPSRLGRVCKV